MAPPSAPTPSTFTIGNLARAAGVPTTTVRFYERRGLLAPGGRSRAKYRVYGEVELERLRFIKAAQGSGFTLDDIAGLLEMRHEGLTKGGKCRPEVKKMIAARLTEVRAKIDDLSRVRDILAEADATCSGSGTGPCAVVQKLTKKSAKAS